MMNEAEYFEVISSIKKDLQENNLGDAEFKLNELFRYKPVRLQWFNVKAELLFKQGKGLDKVYNTLEGKGWQIYNYLGIKEYTEFYTKLAMHRSDIPDTNRHKYIEAELGINEDTSSNLNQLLSKNRIKFINDNETIELLLELSKSYYETCNYLMYEIFEIYINSKYNVDCAVEFISSMSNMGYVKKLLSSQNQDLFIILVSNEEDYADCKALSKVLNDIGKKVYLIDLPIMIEVEELIDIKLTAEVSFENMELIDSIYIIPPVEIIYEGENRGDNREYLINDIIERYSKGNLATVLCSGSLMDELSMKPLLKTQLQRLSSNLADYLEDKMSFGWVGKYTSYISQIYNFDIETEVNRPSECKFSIVIPARNSIELLRHTIKTCLNQRYIGCYEIVISDNSTNGNKAVYDLCCELDDPRIKYYKTPRDLQLSKSFEFAFLKAKGEFIISIGSDDAVLPWTLEVLDEIINQYPEEDIFQWERGFYAWTGFNGGQEHQFIIPGDYKKEEYGVYKIDKIDYFARLCDNPQSMYTLPNLYINSGFRRSYIKTLLNKTSRLWDGICQDIYIGITNICINDYIMNIKYPLTIAGMTPSSIGSKSNKAARTIKDNGNRVEEILKLNNVGGFSTSFTERLMPEVGTDISSLYNSILRTVARGIMPEVYVSKLFGWEKMFLEVFNQLEITDILFDKKLHYFRYTASKHGEEFLKWFDETIYTKAITPRTIDDKKVEESFDKKTYVEGSIQGGGKILDASRYDVTNVYDASLLFEKITGL
ncbi:MAG: glycosyltransferase family 2 protein [Cellulosilyticaceae bacterium]